MKKLSKNEQGFSAVELVLVIIVVVLIGVAGWLVYRNHHKTIPTVTSSIKASSTTPKSTVTTPNTTTSTGKPAYTNADWKTYTIPEDNTISFEYPSNWTVLIDSKDTSTTPYTQTVKLDDPTTYSNGGNFYFILYYSPGKTNSVTKSCIKPSGVVNTEIVSMDNEKLSILTYSNNVPNEGITSGMTSVDGSGCYITTPSGALQVRAGLGTQAFYPISASAWEAQPDSTIFSNIFKSLKF